MLSYKNRLIKRGDFKAVYRHGRPLFCAIIGLKVIKNSIGESRIGISIGIKFSKKAVERNRIKRQIREIFRKNIGKLKETVDIVVFVKKAECSTINTKELEKMITEALSKGKLI